MATPAPAETPEQQIAKLKDALVKTNGKCKQLEQALLKADGMRKKAEAEVMAQTARVKELTEEKDRLLVENKRLSDVSPSAANTGEGNSDELKIWTNAVAARDQELDAVKADMERVLSKLTEKEQSIMKFRDEISSRDRDMKLIREENLKLRQASKDMGRQPVNFGDLFTYYMHLFGDYYN
jgi:chromosome segregation ATPase